MFAGWSDFRRRALLIALIAGAIVFLLWNIPQLDIILYPFRLFVTYVHEAGHGLAALITGGQFLRFEVNTDGSGVAYTAGGARALILPAGYLGAALFGSILFYLTNTLPHPRFLMVGIGALVAGIALLFSGGGSMAALFALIFGLLIGGVLVTIGLRADDDLVILLLNMLAILTGLNAVLDIVYLINNSAVGFGGARNDAAAFQAEVAPLIPASIWALIWSIIAILMLGTAVYFSVVHPLRTRKPPKRSLSDEF